MRQAQWLKLGLGFLAVLGVFVGLFQVFPSKNNPASVWQGIWTDRPQGWQAVYYSSYESEGFASADALAGGAGSTTVPPLRLASLVTATLLKQDSAGARTLRFAVTLQNYPDAPFDTLFKSPLPIQMEASYAGDGLLTQIRVSDQFNPLIRSYLREMAYDFQIAWNPGEQSSRNEDYFIGKLEVNQSELAQDQRRGVLEMKGIQGISGQLSPESFGRKIWKRDENGLLQLETSETWEFAVDSRTLGGQKRRVQYDRQQLVQLSPTQLNIITSQPLKETLDLDSLAEQKILLRKMDIRTVGQENVQSLREKLSALPDEPAGPTDKDLYLLLKAYLRLYPESTAELCRDFILQQPEDSRKFQLVLDALTYSGTAASQQLMIDTLMAKNFEGKESLSILASLGLSPTGSAQTVEFLQKSVKESIDPDVQTTALLAVGNAGRAWGSTDGKSSEQTFEFLKQGLNAAPNEESKRTHLAALGNLGYSEQLDLVRDFIKSPDSPTRVDAMRSLRFCAAPEARKFALEILSTRGSDADLQLASLEVLQNHRITANEGQELEAIFWTLKDERVLQQVLTLVRSQVDPVQARPFLTKVREEHFNPEVRKFARDIILLQE